MTARPEPLTPGQQGDIGRVAWRMRQGGMLWKEIAADLGMCERHLRRCVQIAAMAALMSEKYRADVRPRGLRSGLARL